MATNLFLWSIPIAALIMFALVTGFRPVVRVLCLAAAVILIWVAWGMHGVKWMAEQVVASDTKAAAETMQRLGLAGDLFGGVNALFSALAFGGVAIAAYLQFGTNRHARIQAFEGSFYSSVDLLHRIAEGLIFDESLLEDAEYSLMKARLRALGGIKIEPASQRPAIFRGREVFPALVAGIASKANTPEKVAFQYRSLQVNHNYVLGHYFRHLYQVLKLIDQQPNELISEREKDGYASVLRAQLSTSELALLLLNCTDEMVDQGQFRNLLVRYRMLEHLPYYLDAGYYKARQSDLVLGDLQVMQSFQTQIKIGHPQQAPSGAFGSNPVSIPKP